VLCILYNNLIAYKHLNSEFSRSVMTDKQILYQEQFFRHKTKVSNQLHEPIALYHGKEMLVPTGQAAECDSGSA
jgi:hypothetical protein